MGGGIEMLVKGYKLRWVSFGDLMHSIVIIVNTNTLYFKVANGLDLKCSHHKKEIIMWHDGDVS